MQSIITGSAGLLGALIGFGGALIVSLRAGRIARDQVRYARTYERRDEILATMYGMIYEMGSDFKDVVGLMQASNEPEQTSVEDKNELLNTLLQVHQRIQDFNDYRLKLFVWVPTSVMKTTTELVSSLQDELSTLTDEVEAFSLRDEMWSEGIFERAQNYYNEFALKEINLREQVRTILSVEE